jgi:hypothetical protein
MDFARPDYRRSETITSRRAGAVIGVELQRKHRPSAAGSPHRGVRLAALSCVHGFSASQLRRCPDAALSVGLVTLA